VRIIKLLVQAAIEKYNSMLYRVMNNLVSDLDNISENLEMDVELKCSAKYIPFSSIFLPSGCNPNNF